MTGTEALLAAALEEDDGHVMDVCALWEQGKRTAAQVAAAILATPSGQRLLAPTERERALEAALPVDPPEAAS